MPLGLWTLNIKLSISTSHRLTISLQFFHPLEELRGALEAGIHIVNIILFSL